MQGTYTDFSRFVFNKQTKTQQTDWSFYSSYLYVNMIKTETCKSLCTSQNTFRTTYFKTYTDIMTSCQLSNLAFFRCFKKKSLTHLSRHCACFVTVELWQSLGFEIIKHCLTSLPCQVNLKHQQQQQQKVYK